LLIIRFDKSVPKERRDPNLREKMAAERDGILTWALEGLKRLVANSYTFSETERTAAEIQRYKVDSNSALLFLEECCEVEDGAECVRETLFDKYKDYCSKNGFKALSQTNFNKDVENSDHRISKAVDKLGKRRTWRGLRLQ
jgi:putative DNA primase/helicase